MLSNGIDTLAARQALGDVPDRAGSRFSVSPLIMKKGRGVGPNSSNSVLCPGAFRRSHDKSHWGTVAVDPHPTLTEEFTTIE